MRLLWCHGSQVSMDVAWGSASLFSSHGRGIGPENVLKKDSRGLSRGLSVTLSLSVSGRVFRNDLASLTTLETYFHGLELI